VLVSPSRAPLFFQHDGHSRTVIGIEKRRRPNAAAEDIFLLILDPGTDRRVLSAALRGDKEAGQGTWHRHLKRGLNTLRKREYSVLVVDPGVAQSREEKEGLKILTSKPPEAYTPQRAAAPVG
jgi:formylmethanofuran dehydrogenase subunit B